MRVSIFLDTLSRSCVGTFGLLGPCLRLRPRVIVLRCDRVIIGMTVGVSFRYVAALLRSIIRGRPSPGSLLTTRSLTASGS